MPETKTVDYAAVARIARRVDLRDIRLIDLSAKLMELKSGELTTEVNYATEHTLIERMLQIDSSYGFRATSGGSLVAEINSKFRILYALNDGDPVAENDAIAFAFTNGIFHSWPFLRSLVFDTTARMGFQPCTLPTFVFNPSPPPPKPADTKAPEAAGVENSAVVSAESKS